MLRLVAERDAAAVFPLVERLTEGGADLGEFVSGAGETLRAVLLTGLGGSPEGLTEGLQELVRTYAPRLPAPDVVRLLTVLGEAEGQIRSSGHARLAVEVLLLRWATVELEQVIRALGGGSGKGETGKGKGEAPPVLRDASPTAPPPDRPSAAVAVPEVGPLTLDRLRTLWPRVIADARAASPLLGALLATTEVAAVDGPTLTIRPLEDNAVHTEGIERQREALTRLLGRYVTGPVRVAFGAPGSAPRARAPRLTEDSARADRLTRLRANDPGLSATVDALDLELLE
jgi:hypothetical protein